MTTLQDVFSYLTYGELAQLNIGSGADGSIAQDDYPRLILHIQLGLRDLHTKFPIREREVVIQQYDHMSYYKLSSVYALSTGEGDVVGVPRYIIDSDAAPFTDDVLRIEQVYNEIGQELPLNQPSQEGGVFTPAYNVIQIPQAVGTNALFISYRADHKKIPINTVYPDTCEIEIPDSHFQALLFYVAWRVYASMAGQDSSPVSAEYQNKYLNEVAQITQLNLNLEDTSEMNFSIAREGWA